MLLSALGLPVEDAPTDLLWSLVVHTGFWVSICFVVGTATGNVSQVDKLWSLLPAVYAWQIAIWSNLHPRSVLMAILATLWAARLTYNFARRGGYTWPPWKGEEDYRWPILRKTKPLNNPWVWMAFNLGFICFYQQYLLLLIVLPQAEAAGTRDASELNYFDWICAVMFLGLLMMEYVADQQQYDFQTEKYRLINSQKPLYGEYKLGFLRTGCWSLSRHPNYFCEQSIWVVWYLFSVASKNKLINWTVIGSVLLVLLFQGSAAFSEGISAKKYPAYKEYQATVPCFVPISSAIYRPFWNPKGDEHADAAVAAVGPAAKSEDSVAARVKRRSSARRRTDE